MGASGGAIQQYVYGQNHPGLIDAAIPVQSYPDMVTQTIHVGDCELLERWMDNQVHHRRRRRVAVARVVQPDRCSRASTPSTCGVSYGDARCRGCPPRVLRVPQRLARPVAAGAQPQLRRSPRATDQRDRSSGPTSPTQSTSTARRPTASPPGRGTTSASSTGCRPCVDGDITPEQFLDLNWNVGRGRTSRRWSRRAAPHLGAVRRPVQLRPVEPAQHEPGPDGGPPRPAPRPTPARSRRPTPPGWCSTGTSRSR